MDDSDQTICFCHAVTCGEIQNAIRAGAKTLPQVQAETLASTGCGGCEWDVRTILEEELGKQS